MGDKAGNCFALLLKADSKALQIGQSFGGLCALTRMIVQSECNGNGVDVDLLPALPSLWKSGSLTGVSLKGNLRLDIEWTDGRIKKARIYSRTGTRYAERVTIIYGKKRYEAPLTDGCVDVMNILPSTV